MCNQERRQTIFQLCHCVLEIRQVLLDSSLALLVCLSTVDNFGMMACLVVKLEVCLFEILYVVGQCLVLDCLCFNVEREFLYRRFELYVLEHN
jgi:hypothetical protein